MSERKTFLTNLLKSSPLGLPLKLNEILSKSDELYKKNEIADLLSEYEEKKVEIDDDDFAIINDVYKSEYPSIRNKHIEELIDKITVYKEENIDGNNIGSSFERFKKDIENEINYNKVVYQSITLPPYISHFQLNILSNLMYVCVLGFKVKLLILDEPYNTYKAQRDSLHQHWPSKTNALAKIYEFIEILPKTLKLPSIISNKFDVYLESDLYEEGETKKKSYTNFRNILASKKGLSENLRKTKLYHTNAYEDIAFQENLIREFYFGSVTFKASYIFTGNDRIPLWNFLNEIMATIEPSGHSYLIINKIPTSTGIDDFRLDSNVLFIDKINQNDYDRLDSSFISWFKENINNSSTKKIYRRDIDMIRDYFKNLNESLPNTSAIELIKRLQNNTDILSCYCFGGFQFLNKLKSIEDVHIYDFSGDIDLLFVVKQGRKNYNVAKSINNQLRRFGKVTFHPDFYSKRSSTEVNFDIIILPQQSTYFQKFGVLTWLSVLETNRYEIIFEKENNLKKQLKFPVVSDYQEMKSRILAYKSCHYGINYMQSQVFPHLVKINPHIDYKRVLKYLLYDFYWVITGKFEKSLQELIEFMNNNFKFSSMKSIDFNLSHNDKQLALICYDLILEIKEELNKSTLPNTVYRYK